MKNFISRLSGSTTFRIMFIMLAVMVLLGWAFSRTTTYIVKGVSNANRCIRMSKIVNRDIDEHLEKVENLMKVSALSATSKRLTPNNSRQICDSIRSMANFDSVYVMSARHHHHNDQVVWGKPHSEHGKPVITIAVPLTNRSGRVYAMLCADMNMKWLRDIAERENKTENSELKVVSKEGIIIQAKDSTLLMTVTQPLGKINLMSDSIKEMSATNMFSGKGDGIAIRDSLAEVNSYIPRTGWLVRCIVPMRDGSELATTIMAVATMMLFILFSVIALSIFLVLKWQLSPVLEKYVKELRETTETKVAMERDLDIASKIQIGMLPNEFPSRKDLDMFGTQLAAKSVGGDIFDYILQENKIVFCIGDVSGKGVPAALFMSAVGYLFRNVGRFVNHPEKICRAINEGLAEKNEENMFCTLFVGMLDLTTGRLNYCNAGHNAPIIITKGMEGNKAHFLETKVAMPCGAMPGTQYLEEHVQLTKDDTLFLYTDGVTEAENTEKVLFGDENALRSVEACPGMTSQELIEYMVAIIQDYEKNTEQSDDITMLSIRVPKVGS